MTIAFASVLSPHRSCANRGNHYTVAGGPRHSFVAALGRHSAIMRPCSQEVSVSSYNPSLHALFSRNKLASRIYRLTI